MRPPEEGLDEMRMMMKAQFPTEAGNAVIRNGSLPQIIKKFMEELKPEAAYFVAENGDRCAICFFDLKDASHIPNVAEPFFLGMNAKITLSPCMSAQDLAAAGPHIERHTKDHPKPIV